MTTRQNHRLAKTDVESTPWVVRLAWDSAKHLGPLRLQPGLEVLVQDESVWVRGQRWDERLDRQLRSLPEVIRFHCLPDEQLVEWDKSVPVDILPQGDWTPLERWLIPQIPRAGFAPQPEAVVTLTLVRSTIPDSAIPNSVNALKTSWATWRDFAVAAPTIRLNRLRFALSEQDEALILGSPIPPIPGLPCIENDGVVLPAGWSFDPPIDAATARTVFNLPQTAICLVSTDGTWDFIPQSAFVQATRSAIHETDTFRANLAQR